MPNWNLLPLINKLATQMCWSLGFGRFGCVGVHSSGFTMLSSTNIIKIIKKRFELSEKITTA